MKTLFLSLLVTFASLAVKAQKFIINDPNAQIRTVSSFKGIKADTNFDVYITQGDEDAVAVSASSANQRDRIITKVENGILKIGFNGNGWKWTGNQKLKAYVSVRQLEMINADGACDVELMGVIKGEKMSIKMDGASDINGELNVSELEMVLDGASDSRIKGRAGSLSVKLDGASKFNSYGLITDFCEVDAGGASKMEITVNKELTVSADGVSKVDFKGTGVIRNMRSSGNAKVTKKD